MPAEDTKEKPFLGLIVMQIRFASQPEHGVTWGCNAAGQPSLGNPELLCSQLFIFSSGFVGGFAPFVFL